MNLKGRTIVITGAARGLGQKMAETLAGEGANVALVDVDRMKLKETTKLCSQAGAKATDYAADVTDEQAVVALFNDVRRDFGSSRRSRSRARRRLNCPSRNSALLAGHGLGDMKPDPPTRNGTRWGGSPWQEGSPLLALTPARRARRERSPRVPPPYRAS